MNALLSSSSGSLNSTTIHKQSAGSCLKEKHVQVLHTSHYYTLIGNNDLLKAWSIFDGYFRSCARIEEKGTTPRVDNVKQFNIGINLANLYFTGSSLCFWW